MPIGKSYNKKFGIKSGRSSAKKGSIARRSPDKSVKHRSSNVGKGIFRNLDPRSNYWRQHHLLNNARSAIYIMFTRKLKPRTAKHAFMGG